MLNDSDCVGVDGTRSCAGTGVGEDEDGDGDEDEDGDGDGDEGMEGCTRSCGGVAI